MSIITYPLDGITYDAEDAETYLCTRTSGVFSANDCYNYSLTGDMQITIGTGIAWIRNANYKGKSVYNDAPVALTIPLADSYNPRVDRVVLEFSTANNASAIKIIQGTPATSPSAAAIVQTAEIYQLGLYTIYVERAATVITAANITDTRLDETVCGLMRDSVESIPTSELYAQFMTWFNSIKSAIENVDNALYLEGHPASYFASQSDLTALSNSMSINRVTTLPTSGTPLSENTIYIIASSNPVSNFTFRDPGNYKWAHVIFTAGTNVNFYMSNSANGYLNEVPTIVEGRRYEADVYNRVWAISEITK